MRTGTLALLLGLASLLPGAGAVHAQVDSAAARDTSVAEADRSERWGIGVGALAAVALLTLAGAGFWWWRRRSSGVDTRDYIPQPPVPEFAARQRPVEAPPASQAPSRPGPEFGDWVPHVEADEPASPTSLEEIPLAPGVTRTVPARVATVFAEWCRRGGPMVGRVELFGAALAAAVPEAKVEPVFRDLNAQAEPVRFDGVGGASPAEYWLVHGPASKLLLPHPQSASQFRDVRGVFQGGDLLPSQICSVEPARVAEADGGYVLSQRGHLR